MFVIAYDIGTTGVKTCLFELGETLRLLSGEYEGYGLYILPDGGAEQDADEWWEAMKKSTRRLRRSCRSGQNIRCRLRCERKLRRL